MEEILKIIIKCNKARKLLSVDDVKKICHIVLKNNGYSFVKKVIVARSNPNDKDCGGVFGNDMIVFFYDGVIKLITKYSDDFTDMYQIDGTTVDILNYYFLSIIFHELAHARQQYLANSKYSSLEKRVFSMFLDLSKNKDFYETNYSNVLTEINAVNVSYMTTNYLYNKLPYNFVTTNDKISYNLSMLKNFLYANYEIEPKSETVISPAERITSGFDEDILKSVNMDIEKYSKLIYHDNITLYKKIMLGLPITYLEYAYVNLLIDELNASQDINVTKKLQKIL